LVVEVFEILTLIDSRYGMIRSCSSVVVWGGFGS